MGCDGGRRAGRGALDVEQPVLDHHPRDQLDHRQAVAADQDHATLPRLDEGATLPEAFFKPDALGFRGGVEYGFSSTTTDRAQAVHYAEGKASTVLELVMGMIDRGADISWLSQYPHEKETLLPPLMGLQVRRN